MIAYLNYEMITRTFRPPANHQIRHTINCNFVNNSHPRKLTSSDAFTRNYSPSRLIWTVWLVKIFT